MTGLRIQYGGTFDPVHNGHLAVARNARDRLQAHVWLMPAADPPHKGPTQADAAQRLAMLKLAVAGQNGLQVDDRELRRDGPSWTIDTLFDLRRETGAQTPLAILIGADSFLALPTWKRWESLTDYAHIIIAERPGSVIHTGALPEPLRSFAAPRWSERGSALREAPAGRLLRLKLPLRLESSSEIRARIAQGQPWRNWTPPAVGDYIDQHHLYAAGR